MPDTPVVHRELDPLVKTLEKLTTAIERMPSETAEIYARKDVMAAELARIQAKSAADMAVVTETLKAFRDDITEQAKFKDKIMYGLLGSAVAALSGGGITAAVVTLR